MSGEAMSGNALQHFVLGEWVDGGPVGQPYVDAVTGEQLGTTSSHGLDMAAVVNYARTVGNPAITALTFHERATILRNIGKLLLDDAIKAPLLSLIHI